MESIEVEYEWTPPRVKVAVQSQVEDDGFTKVNNRKNKKKQQSTNQQGSNRQVAVMKLTKPKLNLVYKVVKKQVTDEGTSSQPVEHQSKLPPKHAEKENLVSLSNSFETLNEFKDGPPIKKVYGSTDVDNMLSDDEEDIENVGMNQAPKQKEVRQVILKNNLCLCAILESHVANDNVHGLCSKIMHTYVLFKANKKEVFCSVVYAHNNYIHRRALWKNLKTHKGYVRGRPWVVLGDFNVSLLANEKSIGSSYIDTGMHDFQECAEDVESFGSCSGYPSYSMNSMKRPYAFKFFNLLVHNTRFKEVVSNVWQQTISGFWMFKVVRRLKLLKKPLRKLLFDHGIHENVKKLRHELDKAQKALDSDPSNVKLCEEEDAYLHAYQDAILMKEILLIQKVKIDWLKLGDANTAYFHKVVKTQTTRNIIDSIMDNNGATIDGDQVPLAFIDHYTKFLGANSMIREISNIEIKDTMFSMGDNKAPGPDGFSAVFFKEAWDIIRVDVCKAIKEFFTNGILLKELNHMIIALIPKVHSPVRINDYRLISCCNTLYKCISKILANRMKESLYELISLNQYVFIPGRHITDNILLTQELMHNYHLDRGPARCAFKDGLWNVSRPHRSLLALMDSLMVSLKDGKNTFAWFNNWSVPSPLSNLISNRDIYRAGLGRDARVSDIVLADLWVWPSGWLVKYHPLANIVVPNLMNAADCCTWLNRQNMEVGYSIAAVWECIRLRNNEIDRFNVVWKSARSVTLKLVFAAACYFLLQERNKRLFKKTKRTQDQICGLIKDTVKMKLMSCSFKKSSNV
nr:hypothetical protein [Tanacetum cinerariifolium]